MTVQNTPSPRPAATDIVLDVRITCTDWGSVMMNDTLVGAVENEGTAEKPRWEAINFYEDEFGWENNEHDEPYPSRGHAVRAVVQARWALLEELERFTQADLG